MLAQVLVDKQSMARYLHYGQSMSDIPMTVEVLTLVDEINAEKET